MQDPEPEKPVKSWAPGQKTVGGAVIGSSVAQLIIAIADYYFHSPLAPEISSAITTLCVAVAAYFIPNGQSIN
jgi:hypothetical protein